MTWTISETDLALTDENALATLFCVGNGQVCTRGSLAEDRHESFRGTYISGLFTKAGYGLQYFLAGPDWLSTWLDVGGKKASRTASERLLDMREAVLHRTAEFTSGKVKLSLREQRFASQDVANRMVQQIQVSVDSAGPGARLHLALDGQTRNHPAKYYKIGQLPNCSPEGLRLSRVKHCRAADGALEVAIESRQSGSGVEAVAFVRQTAGPELPIRYEVDDEQAVAVIDLPESLQPGTSLTFLKQTFLYPYHGHDPLGLYESTVYDEIFQMARESDYRSLRDAHAAHWNDFWEAADVEIAGDAAAQRAVRFALYTTAISAPEDEGESSIGAKNLTGDWYRGAVFWDMEMFQLPMLAAVAPHLAANHILYRTNRIDSARALAAQDGYQGARFPWQSYRSGLEEPPVIGGFLYQQVHLNAAVAWGICHYHSLTGDDGLMLDAGLELLLELGKYWLSRCEEGDDGQLHIRNVCGPDEVHKSVDDNAYTNRLAAFVLRRAVAMVKHLRQVDAEVVESILAEVELDQANFEDWMAAADRIALPRLPDGTLAQFEGFADAPQPNPALNREGDRHDRDNTNKQADTLMIFQALPGAMPADQVAACYQTYAPLCHQTSSLSLCTHALLAARLGLARDAQRYFETTIGIDLADQAGNTCHGIHGAAEGGIWLAIVHGYGGLQVRGDGQIHIAPRLPGQWQSLKYRFTCKGQPLLVTVEPEQATVKNAGQAAATVWIDNQAVSIEPGNGHSWSVQPQWQDQPLQAVIFDLDGVLVSTDHFHYLAWKELADELHMEFDESVNHQLRGVSREESLRRIYAHNKRKLPDDESFFQQMTRKNERYKELIGQMDESDVLPGAVELLDALKKAGIKTALASASRNAPRVVELTGLAEKLDAIVDGSVVTHAKPDPQGFYTAAQRLGVLPWNCIGVEDAASGVEAIQRAGMVSVGIGDQASQADVCYESVQQLSVRKLRDAFAGNANPINPYLERNVKKATNEIA
ncbi:MAG: beta-phosphoglucomutase [Phycisphaerae bacterium]